MSSTRCTRSSLKRFVVRRNPFNLIRGCPTTRRGCGRCCRRVVLDIRAVALRRLPRRLNMRLVKTHGLSPETLQACQDRLGDLPVESPIRKEVSPYLRPYRPMVASSESPLLGSSDAIASLIGKAEQRLDTHGRSELNKSILLIPCLCGELTQERVAEALTTVRVQDVATWVAEMVGETMASVRRRELRRPPSQTSETQTAELFADTG